MPMYQSKKKSMPPSLVNCAICTMREECIRCSALAQVDRKHPEKLRDLVVREIYRTQPKPEDQAKMDAGTAAHKELETRRKADTDPDSIVKRIMNKETFYWSMSLCSVRYGLRGTPDAVLCDWQGDTLRFLIIDDKVYVKGSYFVQTWAYAMILTDPNCMYTRSIDGEGQEVERKPFYPAIGDQFTSVEVWTTLNPYKQGSQIVDRPLPAKPFSRARIWENKGLVFAVLRNKRKILDAYSEPALLASSGQMRFHARTGMLIEPRTK